MSKLLGRDAIFAVSDLQTEDVPVPEWGGTVRVKGLTGSERDAFEESCVSGKGKNASFKMTNIRAKLVAKTVVDEKGELIFKEADVEALGKKSGAALDRVFSVAQRISGITKEDIEELEKN
jgi:hypothetical protein